MRTSDHHVAASMLGSYLSHEAKRWNKGTTCSQDEGWAKRYRKRRARNKAISKASKRRNRR